MSSTVGRGEFSAGGENKGFDYSLLLEGEDVETSSSPEPQEKLTEEPVAVPVAARSASDEDSWNTFHKPQNHQQRKDSTGKSPRTFGTSHPPQPQQPQQQIRKPRVSYPSGGNAHGHGERQPIVLTVETTIEMYEFPAALRTADLRKVLCAFDGRYRIKWNNDTSCWAVFNNAEDATAALGIEDEHVKIRRYDPANLPIAAAEQN